MNKINQAIQMELVFIFFIWLALGAATAYMANQRGRDPFVWSMGILTLSFFGLPFALMGVGLLYFLPAIEEEDVPEKHEFDSFDANTPKTLSMTEIAERTWFFYDQSKKLRGPISFTDFRAAWKEGLISNDSYIWSEDFASWKHLHEIPALLDALKGLPPETITTLGE